MIFLLACLNLECLSGLCSVLVFPLQIVLCSSWQSYSGNRIHVTLLINTIMKAASVKPGKSVSYKVTTVDKYHLLMEFTKVIQKCHGKNSRKETVLKLR